MKLLAVIVACVLSGCATESQQTQTQLLSTDRTFNAPKDTVWPLLVAEIGLDYPIQSSDQKSGLITTGVSPLPVGNWNIDKAIRRWVFSPGGNILVGYSGLRVSLSADAVEREPGKTRVEIRAHYEALQAPMGSYEGSWVPVRSNGSLEQDILNRLEGQLPK